ncbi:hypothetical protein NZD89_25500 [Alicyclobacillus fastidiosus]|uniref:Uncharacterized protein n=1 Tax=Alicyclobacillus fastidiosus TaxID=392011 RepID=A0ABY6ZF76_9BACL|nr:hypothetical protein [Alicyclobacillus fastidiosus]WAH41554.1 hypothetical protein NZD89_25500 [Alicyclobacillus fastidiosus]GMA63212.1 hypothetical protein GCM10025859_36520 [Alicyclobacillus fastidiosus]
MARVSEKAWVWCLIPAGVTASLAGVIVGSRIAANRAQAQRNPAGQNGSWGNNRGQRKDAMCPE